MLAPVSARADRHRYGIVLLLTLVVVIFLVLSTTSEKSRAIGLFLQGLVLIAVVVTSESDRVRARRWGFGLLAAVVVTVVLVFTGSLPDWLSVSLGAALVLAPLPTLVTQLARLLRTRGVTIEALSGALAVYLLVGLLFALVIGVVAEAGSTAYFANGTDGDVAEHVYFSFTTLTTTGFGDLTAATRVGHALAVLEMLIGQIYLVTIIGLLVGNLRPRRSQDAA